jgi:protein tyrosine kinase modulator
MRDELILIYSYLYGIWRYRWSALVVCWVFALIGWSVVYLLPNQYTAKGVVHIDSESIMKPLLKGLTVDSEVDSGLPILSELLLSRKNLEEVVRQSDLDLGGYDTKSMDDRVKQLTNSITLNEKGRKSSIYELTYQGSSAELVYQVTSKLLNKLIETIMNSGRTDTAAAQQFLDTQIAEYEARLSASEQQLADFKRANVGFMPDERGGYYDRLQREQGELDKLRSELTLAKRKLSEMKKQLEGESPLLDNSSYGASQILKLRKYREQLEVLLTQYTEQHPDVQALRANIADILANQGSENDEIIDIGAGDSVEFNPVYQDLKADINRASVDVETLKISLDEKTKSVDALKQAVDVLPEVEAKLATLNRDYDITRDRYLDLISRRENARLAQEVGLSGGNVAYEIINTPRVPAKPSGPKRVLLLTAVLFVAMCAGLGWGFLMYLIQPTFIDSSQINNKINRPILGSVGLYMTAEHKKSRRLQLASFMLVLSLLVVLFIIVVVFNASGSEMLRALVKSPN